MKKHEVYVCDVCDKEYKTASSCRKHETECKAKQKAKQEQWKIDEYWRNYVRLNAETIHDIPRLVTYALKQWKDVDVEIKQYPCSLRKTSYKYEHPIKHQDTSDRSPNNPVEYVVFQGFWEGSCKDSSFSFTRTNMVGIHTGTGGGGDSFRYEGYMFVDDFPKIKEKYDHLLESGIGRVVDSAIVSVIDKTIVMTMRK